MLLQYFLLATLVWMLIEGHHMYKMLVVVFITHERLFITKRMAIGWVLIMMWL